MQPQRAIWRLQFTAMPGVVGAADELERLAPVKDPSLAFGKELRYQDRS